MATASSPTAGLAIRNIMTQLAKGGQQTAGGQTDAPVPGGDTAGQQISAQLSELQNADPNTMLDMLRQVKTMLVALYSRSAFALPEVARGVAASQRGLDQAIRAAEQGAATIEAVSAVGNLISNGAGQPSQQAGNPLGQLIG